MHQISLKWTVKLSLSRKNSQLHKLQGDLVFLSGSKMTEPFNISNSTNAPAIYDNYTYNMNDDFTRVVSISVFVSFSFIFLVGLMGNCLVVMGELSRFSFQFVPLTIIPLTVVASNPTMRSTTNILIINLAVADLLFVIFCKATLNCI